ncbi:hypothetical protein [Gordonia sp. (in: high G+C Gram-positive bacteria)]|uniref:hypothetical protein n=1 Tax=Gordonia sp. (in: high G+C Gram-positive bacteria) TaxID=84139 RepID=UPI003C7917C4
MSSSNAGNPALWAEHRINGTTYLGELAAQRYAGRSKVTLWDWRRRGTVVARKIRTADGYAGWIYHRGSLRIALREASQRKANQLHVAGPGRGYKGMQGTPESRERAVQRQAARQQAERDRRAAMRAAAEEAERLEDAEYARKTAANR